MKRLVKKTRIKAQGWNTNGRLLFLRRGDLGTDDMRQKQIRDLSRQPVGLPPFYFGSQVFPISKIGFFNPLQSTSMIVTVICQMNRSLFVHFLHSFIKILSVKEQERKWWEEISEEKKTVSISHFFLLVYFCHSKRVWSNCGGKMMMFWRKKKSDAVRKGDVYAIHHCTVCTQYSMIMKSWNSESREVKV